MDSEDDDNIPQNILETARLVSLNLLPSKSRERYEKEYEVFKQWLKENHVKRITEDAVLVYFSKKAETLKASTLWSKYSMLRSCVNIKENVDIKFPKVIAFLKRQASGFRSKKACTFTREDVNKFISQATDQYYLHMKVRTNNFLKKIKL